MKHKIIIIIAVICVLAAAVGIVILTRNGEKAKPHPLEEIEIPELVAPGNSKPEDSNGGLEAPDLPSILPSSSANEETDPETNAPIADHTNSQPETDAAGAVSPQQPSDASRTPDASKPESPRSTEAGNSPIQDTQASQTPPGTVRITFVDRDETVLSTQTIPEGGSVIPPTPPAHDGAVFMKWDTILTDLYADRTVHAIYRDTMAPTVAVDNVYVDAAQKTVTVNVLLYNNPGLSSLFLDIMYPEGLTLQAVTFDERFGEYVTAAEPYRNPQSISILSPFSDVYESGTFATLTFLIGDSVNLSLLEIGISCDQDNTFNASFEEVVLTTLDGSITRIS